jgi:phage-related protein
MPQTRIFAFREVDGAIPIEVWLDEISKRSPQVHAKCLQRIQLLEQLGFELRRPLADFLRDGIYELRIRHRSSNYRILYFFNGRNVVFLSHGLTKEDRVPDSDIDLAFRRMKLVEADTVRHTAEFQE